ncbi:MAG: hypothetical protein O9322_13580 [Beijerinckiaceae bacterium]|nr:hypothetical protein [Beijerinckiaceae bacterium]MCZ8300377.1 hypothetical protein [Beijerinckiaceae bacterium]
MTDAINAFNLQLKTHVAALEDRLSAFNARLSANLDHADKEIRHQLTVLEGKATSAKTSAEASAAVVSQWVADSVHSVEAWKEKLDLDMLAARAERADQHAKAASEVAMEAFFAAERAALHARLAHADMEGVRAARTS